MAVGGGTGEAHDNRQLSHLYCSLDACPLAAQLFRPPYLRRTASFGGDESFPNGNNEVGSCYSLGTKRPIKARVGA